MKKLITIILAGSLGFAAGTDAKPNDAQKKSAAKAGPPQPQHVNPPKNSVKPQHQTLRKSNVIDTKQPRVVHPKNLNAQSLKKQQPSVQSNELPAVQKNQKNIVAPNTKPIPNIQNIQAKYKNFKAKPNPASIPAVQFNQNYQIAGAQNWSGPQYQVFASYRPQWHDQGWWRSNYGASLLLIGGGWYYWNAGYWYPAWGYDPGAAYYPYDGPIYTGETRRPFDEVVANVQASLQEQGYYQGEVDGLMGPLTRQALADFQRDHGLISTAALDQPTLSSLGLG